MSAAAGLLSLLLAGAAEPADQIFVNGVIWTGDPVRPRAEALAVRGERLAAVGSGAEVGALRGPRTRVTDLRGRFVAPGFDDAHLHFLVTEQAELDGVTSVEQLQGRLRDYARSHPESAWVTGHGWGYAAFPGNAPHRRFLDAVVADRPVLLHDRDGHSALANSKALALAGVTRETPDPEDGLVDRDAAGEPSGLLKEAAIGLVARHVPEPGPAELERALRLRLEQAASYGLTSIQNASFAPDQLPVFEKALKEGWLTLRVYWAWPMKPDPSPQDLAEARALRERHAGPWIKFGAVKGLLDGTVDARTAAMLEPYVGGGSGLPMWPEDQLKRSAAAWDAAGFQMMLHAIGDKAIRLALDAFEHAARVNGTSGRRHRVEHAEVPDPADLPRFARLGVIASTQALFANPDQTTLENYAPLLGPARAARANAFGRFDQAGAVQAFGSDWPVFPMEPLRGIYCAATRQTPEGTPAGGWHPENRIPAEAALRHFTADAAYASFDEAEKGTLSPGKLADFVVLSQDLLQGPPERLRGARVLLTVVGGRESFRSPAF